MYFVETDPNGFSFLSGFKFSKIKEEGTLEQKAYLIRILESENGYL